MVGHNSTATGSGDARQEARPEREVLGRVGEEKIERAIRHMMDHGMRSREAAKWVRDWIMSQGRAMRPDADEIALWRNISDLTYTLMATHRAPSPVALLGQDEMAPLLRDELKTGSTKGVEPK